MVRRVSAQDQTHPNVSVRGLSLDRCAKLVGESAAVPTDKIWTADQFAAKLHTFGQELAEGFFASCVVLVEGVGDQSVINSWMRLKGRDPHAEGIVIAQVAGKNNLCRPIAIFKELDIPCFWIFDNDKDKGKDGDKLSKFNRQLQRLGGLAVADCVDWPEGCFEQFASWNNRVEKYVRECAGAEFDLAAKELASKFNIHADEALRLPACAREMLERLASKGVAFSQLDKILAAVDKRAAQ
jgi:predicted ATP-dependent endonuclease of OLD family